MSKWRWRWLWGQETICNSCGGKEERDKDNSVIQVPNAMKGMGTPNGSEQLDPASERALIQKQLQN
jgi:hypothetical protein